MFIKLEIVEDWLSENYDCDSRLAEICDSFFGTQEAFRLTRRIIDYFSPQIESDGQPRKKLKGVSLDDVGETMLYMGWVMGFLTAKEESK